MAKHGPNFTRLISHKVVCEAMPEGGGLWTFLKCLRHPAKLAQHYREAVVWVTEIIDQLRTSPGNHWGESEEVLAGKLLDYIEGKDD